jgi:hypothetical protein
MRGCRGREGGEGGNLADSDRRDEAMNDIEGRLLPSPPSFPLQKRDYSKTKIKN